MIKIEVLYGSLFDSQWQTKTFKDETSCMEWCRRNSEKIGRINDYRTGFQPISHFEIIDAIRGKSNLEKVIQYTRAESEE